MIKDNLLERIDQIEIGQGRKVGGKERREIKEELEFELLPRAFTKTTHIDAWIDSNNSQLIINTGTASKAEALAKLLRNTIDELSITLPEIGSSIPSTMTNWLNSNKPPRGFEFGQECLFKSVDDQQSTVAFKKHELPSNELKPNFDAGKFLCQIELIWQQKIKFILTEELILKRVKFLDIMADNFDRQGFETAEEKIDTEFALMVGEATQLLQELNQALIGRH